MSLDDPVILTCAISGAVANRDQCPAIPYTPAEYAAEARRAVDEGASMIHIHARTPPSTPMSSSGSRFARWPESKHSCSGRMPLSFIASSSAMIVSNEFSNTALNTKSLRRREYLA